MRLSARICLLSLTLLFVGCGGDDSDPMVNETMLEEESPSDPAASPESMVQPMTAPVTVEDIDRWQRGMEAELQAVREAGTRLSSARSGTDSLNAMMGANDMTTVPAGAQAAGVSADRYQYIRSNLSAAVGLLSPLSQEMDVSQMPATMVEQMEAGRRENLVQMSTEVPTAVVDALRPRAAALRQQDLTLTGERLRASGIGG